MGEGKQKFIAGNPDETALTCRNEHPGVSEVAETHFESEFDELGCQAEGNPLINLMMEATGVSCELSVKIHLENLPLVFSAQGRPYQRISGTLQGVANRG